MIMKAGPWGTLDRSTQVQAASVSRQLARSCSRFHLAVHALGVRAFVPILSAGSTALRAIDQTGLLTLLKRVHGSLGIVIGWETSVPVFGTMHLATPPGTVAIQASLTGDIQFTATTAFPTLDQGGFATLARGHGFVRYWFVPRVYTISQICRSFKPAI